MVVGWARGGGNLAWMAQLVKRQPLAQVLIPVSWDRASYQALCSVGSLLLPRRLALPLFMLSLSNK